jgi:transitional endoplasmic reticulum ATPase
LQSNTTKPIIVLAATNRPDSIDTALLRPGRFDRLVYVPPPDWAARKAIFEVHTRRMPLHTDVTLDKLANDTEACTGADIAAICQQAGFLALEESVAADALRMKHFQQAIDCIPPSIRTVSAVTFNMYEGFRRQCGSVTNG